MPDMTTDDVYHEHGISRLHGFLREYYVDAPEYHREIPVPADAINLSFVLGNKVLVGAVNAGREDFEAAVRDMAVAEAEYPGWLERLFTRKVEGLNGCPQEVRLLESAPGSIKTFVEVAPLP